MGQAHELIRQHYVTSLSYMSGTISPSGLTYLRTARPEANLQTRALYLHLSSCVCIFLKVHIWSVRTSNALIAQADLTFVVRICITHPLLLVSAHIRFAAT